MSGNQDDGDLADFLDDMAANPDAGERKQRGGQSDAQSPDQRPKADHASSMPEAKQHTEREARSSSGSRSSGGSRSSSSSSAARAGGSSSRRAASDSAPARSRSQSSARGKSRRGSSHDQFKAMSVPALLIVGVLMLIPGVWALGVLGGIDIWRSGKQGADTVALAMLTAWPIAACLFFGAWYYHNELRKAKARREQRESRR